MIRTQENTLTTQEIQLKRAFQRGMGDAHAEAMNLRRVSNPYPDGSMLSNEYKRGFADAVKQINLEYYLSGYGD